MKKILIVSLLGIVIGTSFALLVFSSIKNNVTATVSNTSSATAFQVRVFNVYDNALKMSKKFDAAYIYSNDNKHYVYIAIFQNQELINKMYELYQEKNINVYLKNIMVSNQFLEELTTYEELLMQSNNTDTYFNVNKNILKSYGESI